MSEPAAADLGFAYRVRKDGSVELLHRSRAACTLRGAAAQEFVDEMLSCTPAEAQQTMARLTGNYKRGNERDAAAHPRNRR